MVQYSYPRMAGSLYVVSTPIGNLDDITVRALNTLKSVGLVAAEDTRRTGLLLRHFGIATPTTSLHEHNETEKVPALLRKLSDGVDIALVSDAGTPLVSDPGQRLIAAAIEHRIRVIPIPGASAVLAALAASGYPADEFVFAGFAPSRSKDRKQWLERLARDPRAIVFFETPHRIIKTLSEMADILGDRPITIARELTKVARRDRPHHRSPSGTRLKFAERGSLRSSSLRTCTPASRPEDVDDADAERLFLSNDQILMGLSRRAGSRRNGA